MNKHQKGYFTHEEDKKLIILYNLYKGQWKIISELFQSKTPRQCHDRWVYYLSPSYKKSKFSSDEFKQLIHLVNHFGHNWKIIGIHMNRSGNQVKNVGKKISKK